MMCSGIGGESGPKYCEPESDEVGEVASIVSLELVLRCRSQYGGRQIEF